MASTTLNLSGVEKRMLSAPEAASYCGMAAKHFKALCPVNPIELRLGDIRWDKRDLDAWIDSCKQGAEEPSREAILGKLG